MSEKKNDRKLPKPKERKSQASSGSTEGPNQEEHKETYFKTYIIIIMPNIKDKERTLKAAKEKQEVTYKGTPKRLAADFSTETLKARREW